VSPFGSIPLMGRSRHLLPPIAAVLLALLCSCSRGVSNCTRNAGDTWRQAGRSIGSLDVLGAVTDVVMMPVTTASDCATAMALSPIQTLQAQQQRSVKAVHVTPEEAEASANRARPSGRSSPTAAGTTPAPVVASKEEDPCQYRSGCVVASTLVVGPSRTASASGDAPGEHAQYELTNDCGEPIVCFICGTKSGTVLRDFEPCNDSNHSALDIGETWITKGTTQGVDGMALTCLEKSKGEDPTCRTWPK
jgi:hypothetical protein